MPKKNVYVNCISQAKLHRRWSGDVKLLHRLHRLGGASAQADASSAASKRLVLTPRDMDYPLASPWGQSIALAQQGESGYS